jgi:MoxR-like ATPase
MGDAKWKTPVCLDDVTTEFNSLEEELKALNGWDCLIVRGPAGIGKTYSALEWAKQNGWEAFVQECSGDMGYFDLVGSFSLDGSGGMVYYAGVVASAMHNAQEGKKTLLVMDEINLLPQAVLKAIGSVFDFRKAVETPVGRLYGNGNFRVVATMNSEAESAGFDLDDALQSRFLVITLDAGEMSKRFLKAGMVDELTSKLIKETEGAFSLREAQQVIALSPIYGPQQAMKMVVNKYTNEDKRKLVTNAVLLVLGEERGKKLI